MWSLKIVLMGTMTLDRNGVVGALPPVWVLGFVFVRTILFEGSDMEAK